MRCKACNTILDDVDLSLKDKNGVYCDMCHKCRDINYLEEYYERDKSGKIVKIYPFKEGDVRFGYAGGFTNEMAEILKNGLIKTDY